MNTTINRIVSDVDIKNNVLSELRYEPSVITSDIGVLVKDGTVTLNGYASSYWEKSNALRAAKRVVGVNAIADDIQVKLPGSVTHTDGDIGAAAAQQLKWSSAIPKDSVKVSVREGWITLEGQVEWWYQKDAAESAVHYLFGVKGVLNDITIKPKLSALSIESDIQAAFKRSAMFDADAVTVETTGSKVVLSGEVRTNNERDEAQRTAWAASGVMAVDNLITVDWSWLDN